MAGWIVTDCDPALSDPMFKRFKRCFEVAGVPSLRMETTLHGQVSFCRWAWSPAVDFPDSHILVTSGSSQAFLLDGYLTAFGENRRPALDDVARQWNHRFPQVVSDLDGSFSFAVADLESRSIHLVCDRLASRPIWFLRRSDFWIASNHSAAISAMFGGELKLDPAGVWSLIATSRHVGRKGLYAGLQNLHGGEVAVLESRGAAKISRWHERKYNPDYGPTLAEWGRAVASAVRRSSGRITGLEGKGCLFLSGGLDSRVVVGAFEGGVDTMTLTTSVNMNSRVAARVSAAAGSSHTTFFRPPDCYLETFEAAALVAGGNYNIRHAHFIYPVASSLAQGETDMSFMLGDFMENFDKHYFKIPAAAALKLRPDDIDKVFLSLFSFSHPSPENLDHLFQPGLANTLRESWATELRSIAKEVWEVSEDPRDAIDTLFRWRSCNFCPTFLMLECIRPLTMERNIMFDKELDDLLMRIPAGVRGAHQLHRRTLWNLNKSLAMIPNSNSWLPVVLPQAVHRVARVIRPQLGRFRRRLRAIGRVTPVTQTAGSWHMLQERFRKDPAHRDFIEDCLFDESALPHEIFNPDGVSKAWADFLSGNLRRAFEIDVLLSFGLLHRRIGSRGLT